MNASSHHLRPARGWLNDPNGMVHHEGRWHVFFQHNPDRAVHDQIAWGHASSADLLTWQEHPVAFRPAAAGPDAHGCWSGVHVPGLPEPAVVYTGLPDGSGRSTVCLRHGSHDLQEWGEPVVVAEQPDEVPVMRDPFLFERFGRRWALVGAGLPGDVPAILLFACDDILAWDYVGVWARGTDPVLDRLAPADVWECPQLVDLGEGRVALVVSLHDRGVLGQVMAATGELDDVDQDGRPGVPWLRPETAQVLDTGNAYYAPQVADDPDPDAWVMGWVREDGDPDRDQVGSMSLPRRLVRDGRGCRLVLDPRVADAVTPAFRATTAQRLIHPRLGTVDLPTGSSVYVERDVTEVYRPGQAPHTTRHPHPWDLVGPGP